MRLSERKGRKRGEDRGMVTGVAMVEGAPSAA